VLLHLALEVVALGAVSSALCEVEVDSGAVLLLL
jgi:hypothetical protein